MSALQSLIIAGAAAALFSAPAVAMERASTAETVLITAQEGCRSTDLRCDTAPTAEYCIAEDKCAVALPGSALIRYDARMDAAAL